MTVNVSAAGPEHRATPEQQVVWDALGALISATRVMLNDDEAAFTVLLSRLSREMRRVYGLADAQAAFRGIADTMPAAAEFDVQDVPAPSKDSL